MDWLKQINRVKLDFIVADLAIWFFSELVSVYWETDSNLSIIIDVRSKNFERKKFRMEKNSTKNHPIIIFFCEHNFTWEVNGSKLRLIFGCHTHTKKNCNLFSLCLFPCHPFLSIENIFTQILAISLLSNKWWEFFMRNICVCIGCTWPDAVHLNGFIFSVGQLFLSCSLRGYVGIAKQTMSPDSH